MAFHVLDPTGLLYAALTGCAVVLVTVMGDRLGGRIGGMLATAPVTTSAAHVVLAASVAPEDAPERILQGVQALLAVTFGILAFFYTVWVTGARGSRIRLSAGLVAFVGVFIGLTLTFATFPFPPVSGFILLFAIHAGLALSFMREIVPDRPVGVDVRADDTPGGRGPRRSLRELVGRFLSGAVVVLLIRYLIDLSPALAGALAVVPAVFIISLTVLGLRHDALFAARASQAGLFGATGVAMFVLVVAAGLHLQPLGGIWTSLPFAWAAYGGTLYLLSQLHGWMQRNAGLVERDPRHAPGVDKRIARTKRERRAERSRPRSPQP